jgi:hypothetical protein|tara:strand:+ start:837 stop:1196 length:360 start_codon:yes stop_codon:yes gene_type:complete
MANKEKVETGKTTWRKDIKNKMVEYLNKDNKTEIYSVIRHVARSGEMRYISFHVISSYNNENYLGDITKSIGLILDLPYSEKHNGLRIKGCGMDMAFHTVYNLSDELYGDGYKLRSKII